MHSLGGLVAFQGRDKWCIAVAGFALLMLGIAGCADDHVRLTAGGACELASECAAPLTCRLSRCRNECVSSRDCAAGLTCVQDNDGLGGCLLPEESHCALNSECPTGLICVSTKCTNPCAEDRDCVTGATCDMADDGTRVCVEPPVVRCALNSDCEYPLVCDANQQCTQECIRRDGCSESDLEGATCHVDCPRNRYCQDGIFRCVLGSDYTHVSSQMDGGVPDSGPDMNPPSPDAGVVDFGGHDDGGVAPIIYYEEAFADVGSPPSGWSALNGSSWSVLSSVSDPDAGVPESDGELTLTSSACETCPSGWAVIGSPMFDYPLLRSLVVEFDVALPAAGADSSMLRFSIMDRDVTPSVSGMSSTGWQRIHAIELDNMGIIGARHIFDYDNVAASRATLFEGGTALDTGPYRVRAVFCSDSAYLSVSLSALPETSLYSSTRSTGISMPTGPSSLRLWFEASGMTQKIGRITVRSPLGSECP